VSETDATTAAIESAIAHIPDDGGTPDAGDLSPDLGTDDTDADPASAADPAAVAQPAATDPAATAESATPAAVEKKTPKYVPFHRFDAQQKAKVAAEERAAKIEADIRKEFEWATPQTRENARIADLLENNIEHVVDTLLADPRYSALITRKEAREAVEAAAAGTPRPAGGQLPSPAALPSQPPAFPPPDLQMADGTQTWSPESLHAHNLAVAEYATAKAEAKLEARIAKAEKDLADRIAPFESKVVNEELAHRTMKERSAEFSELESDYGADFIKEHKPAMLAWLRDQWGNKDAQGRPTTAVKNAKAGLREAERAILKPAHKILADQARATVLSRADAQRTHVIEEANRAAAKADERPSAAARPKVAEESGDLSDVINRSLARQGL
jgi:hypothetical protein